MAAPELLLVRHAIAEERGLFAHSGEEDALRPLTEQGRRRMRQGVRGLTFLLPALDAIATSPLLRARQTADLLAKPYRLTPIELEALSPGQPPEEFLAWLVAQRGRIAAVGHQPDLGSLATWLLSGQAADYLPLKKGGACLLDFPQGPEAGGAQLRWLLTPRQLRLLGEGS